MQERLSLWRMVDSTKPYVKVLISIYINLYVSDVVIQYVALLAVGT